MMMNWKSSLPNIVCNAFFTIDCVINSMTKVCNFIDIYYNKCHSVACQTEKCC